MDGQNVPRSPGEAPSVRSEATNGCSGTEGAGKQQSQSEGRTRRRAMGGAMSGGTYEREVEYLPPHVCPLPLRDSTPILSNGKEAGGGTTWRCECGRLWEVRGGRGHDFCYWDLFPSLMLIAPQPKLRWWKR